MILKIYLLIFSFFLLGAYSFKRINQKKSIQEGRQNWIKYFSFLIIIHIIFLTIVFQPDFFKYLAILILTAGFLELFNLYRGSGWQKTGTFIVSLIIFSLFTVGFYYFSLLEREVLLFTFLITAGFDSFSQISGQLNGKRKLLPKISPSKTTEGLIGGIIIGLIIAVLLRGLLHMQWLPMIIISLGIIFFSFFGDIFSSMYKRQYRVKDFSNILPGHGGFLDRFDSFIASGAFMGVVFFLFS